MMTGNNDIFSLLLLISFLWYICHKNDNKDIKESFIIDNTTGVPSMTADKVYRYNGDLNYAANRTNVPVSFLENIATQRVAPIINPVTGRIIEPDENGPLGVQQFSHLQVPDQKYSSRIHDDISGDNYYNVRLPYFNDLQGGSQNTNRFKPYPRRTISQYPDYMK